MDLGSEYRVEGRTCARGSCGGWSDLFEVEVPAAAPTATATATPSPTSTATATGTATATATSTATTTPEVMVDPATACYFLHSIVATATPTPTPTAANGSAGKETGEVTRDSVCSFPKLKRFLQRYACDAEAQMSANGARSDGGGFVEMTFMVEIKIVEGGDSGNVVSFLHANGAVGVIDWGVWVDAERVFQSVLGELSELPDVEFVQEMDGPSTGYSVAPSEQPAGPASATQRTMAQTFTDAPVWHGAKAWHNAGPPLRGDDVQIGVIDVGFNGFRDLQGTGKDLPANVESFCEFSANPTGGSLPCEVTPVPTPLNEMTPTPLPGKYWHGTAVSEAVMDIAPNADLFIARARNPRQLNKAVVWMKDQGVDIINSPMRTSVDLGSEYRVEGRTCARGSCGGWSDLFEVEVPAAAPTATPTPTASPTATPSPTPTATSTATSTATATATSTPTPEVVADPANACYLLHSIAATATPTAASGSASQDASASASDVDCSYPKIKGYLGDEIRDLCRAKAQMLAEGVRSSNQDGWEPSYILDIKIVDGGSSESVIAFLTGIGSDFYESRSEKVHWISTGKVPRSQIGPLSELLDVELIRRPSPANLPGTSILPRQLAAKDSANQGTVSQTLTDASLWHGVDVWHRLGLSW